MEIKREDGVISCASGPAIVGRSLKAYFVRGRLHRADGPAVETTGGTQLYFWRGVRVPPEAILAPKSLTPSEILKLPNAEVRRAWSEAYGLESFLPQLIDCALAKLLDEDQDWGRLWEVKDKDVDDSHRVYVEVTCPSTGRVYFLRVAPDQKKVIPAIASTFTGVDAKDYARCLQS